ncbi:MAG: hypothetical protein LBF84_00955 [Holosporales bacterium]|jgi:hypothetical protein|nr:hypothetical protein [Holosporales bacterium]
MIKVINVFCGGLILAEILTETLLGLSLSNTDDDNVPLYIKKLIKKKGAPQCDQIWFCNALREAETLEQVVTISLMRGCLAGDISLDEISALWSLSLSTPRLYVVKGGADIAETFKQLLIIYFSGEVIGRDIYSFYTQDPVGGQLCGSTRIQELIMRKIKNVVVRCSGSGQYEAFIRYTLEQLYGQAIRKYLHSKMLKTARKLFNDTVAMEFAMLFVRRYTRATEKEAKEALALRLSKTPPRILILAGQRFMSKNKADSFSMAIVAYTMAAIHDNKFQKQLGFLIQSLICNNCAKDFERLVPDYHP